MYYVNCARHRPLKRNHLQRYICSLKKLAHNCFFLQRNFDNLVKCEHKERESGKMEMVARQQPIFVDICMYQAFMKQGSMCECVHFCFRDIAGCNEKFGKVRRQLCRNFQRVRKENGLNDLEIKSQDFFLQNRICILAYTFFGTKIQ